MELQTLKKWRIIVPGVMIIALVIPLRQQSFNLEEFLRSLTVIDTAVRGVAAVVCGVLYYLTNLRRYFLRGSLNEITDNIKARLLEPCLHNSQVAAAADRLRAGRQLMDVFYHFVDNDKSLTERAKSVRLNGLIWSSIADFMAIGTVGALLYWCAALLTPRPHYIWFAAILAAAQFPASWLLLPAVTRRHITLSNEQLDYIRQTYGRELLERVKQLV